jgi:hypothetical protein
MNAGSAGVLACSFATKTSITKRAGEDACAPSLWRSYFGESIAQRVICESELDWMIMPVRTIVFLAAVFLTDVFSRLSGFEKSSK